MSLYVFSTFVLSVIFMLVLGTWWDGHAPFKIYLAALAVVTATMLSATLMIAIYPILGIRSGRSRKESGFDNLTWGRDVSSGLSTPAAVLNGYGIAFANKAFLSELGMLGMNEQIIGMPLTNLVHPADHQCLASLVAQAAQEGEKNGMIKLRLLHSDGTILPVQASLSPLREGGSPDINLLQLSPASSLESSSTNFNDQFNYHLLIDQIEQIVFQVNAASEIIFLNPSWEHLLDHKVAESMHKPLLSFIHPEDRPLIESHLTSLTQGKRPNCQLETRLIAKNGDSHWVELRAKNISTCKNERSSVVGTLTNISRMKMIESSLRANRRSLSTLISNTPGMIYRCKNDKNWTFEFVSDGCLEVTGYEPYEMVENPNFSYVSIIHPEDRPRTWSCVQQQIANQGKFQMIYRIISRSGAHKWVWEQGTGVYSSAGELLALEGFITDISQGDEYDAVFQELLPTTPIV
ncbi:PAS domain-containing protein [Glaciimonas sp. PCH181]|uniref:PAS domain-containing protein n=1 Tax=Glaciimonas sp. PCH181 TaxID=2133943 RepID=UPI000D33CA53|nr:PAS domain-containing protein [Glaciimonas sp. PCH181]PUA19830.1 histidine kinase [Glaciimonas sp. PCH181]